MAQSAGCSGRDVRVGALLSKPVPALAGNSAQLCAAPWPSQVVGGGSPIRYRFGARRCDAAGSPTESQPWGALCAFQGFGPTGAICAGGGLETVERPVGAHGAVGSGRGLDHGMSPAWAAVPAARRRRGADRRGAWSRGSDAARCRHWRGVPRRRDRGVGRQRRHRNAAGLWWGCACTDRGFTSSRWGEIVLTGGSSGGGSSSRACRTR